MSNTRSAPLPPSYPAPPSYPQTARLLAPATECSFVHLARTTVPVSLDALGAWNAVMAQPLPLMGLAFRLRDAISARFGVRKIGGFSTAPRHSAQAGEYLDFFLVEEITPTRLLLSERDRHLDVLTCVTATPCPEGTEIAITSSVKPHNTFGRLYMVPVGPAHKLIVRVMLARLRKTLLQSPPAPFTSGPNP